LAFCARASVPAASVRAPAMATPLITCRIICLTSSRAGMSLPEPASPRIYSGTC
jgi:hypothetical protein